MNTHTVLRPFRGPGATVFTAGDEVDASGWRMAGLLEEQRYLRPLSVIVESEDKPKRGRPRLEKEAPNAESSN